MTRGFVLLMVVALAAGGCSDRVAPSMPVSSPSPVAQSELPDSDDDATFLEQWRVRLPEYLDKASAFERRLIADGVVTKAEHEEAIIAHLDCIRRAGFSNVSVTRTRSGMIGVLSVADPRDSGPAVLACQAEFYTYAREGFRDTTWDPDGTEAAQLRNLAACIRSRGVTEVPEIPKSFLEIDAIIDGIGANDDENVRNAQTIFGECQSRELW